MFDIENDEDIQDISILRREKEEDYDSENNFKVKDMTNNILKKNEFLTGKVNEQVMTIIIKMLQKLGFNFFQVRYFKDLLYNIKMIKTASKINDDELFLLLKLFHNLFLELVQIKKLININSSLNQNLMKNKMRKLKNKFLYS